MQISRVLSVAMVALPVVACQTLEQNPKQTVGMVLGGVGGGVAGAQFGKGKGQIAATILGTLLGAAVGSEVGKSLDQADQMYAEQSANHILEFNKTGQTATWSNPQNGHQGSFTPTRTYRLADGAPCREFVTTVLIQGRQEVAIGRACRQLDGTWRLVP